MQGPLCSSRNIAFFKKQIRISYEIILQLYLGESMLQIWKDVENVE